LPTRTVIDADSVVVVISREEVEARDPSSVLGALKSCVESPERALSFFEKLDIAFHGYDLDAREVFEIFEVREFVSLVDGEFPYWLFFLTKKGLGLQAIMLCFMPPYLTEQARKMVLPQRLDQLLSNRWFPAMNQICEAVGFSEGQIATLTNNVADYFINGPRSTATRMRHGPDSQT
jgi:hypothetical protein